jgi:hypothetical protein
MLYRVNCHVISPPAMPPIGIPSGDDWVISLLLKAASYTARRIWAG